MIKIFENTETLLIDSINQFSRMAPNLRCVHLKLSKCGERYFHEIEMLKLSKITEEIFDKKTSYFFYCQDGDVFIIAPHISPKLYDKFLTHLVENLRLASYEKLASLFELGHDSAKLVKIVENKKRKINLIAKKKTTHSLPDKKSEIDFIDSTSSIAMNFSKRRANRSIRNILVIEDDPFTRKLIASALGADFSIDFATDGAEGIKKYVRNAPDILLLDIGLPDMNGHEVMERIKKLDTDAQIIMLTARKEAHEILYSLHNGAHGYVSKPFSKAKLLQHMNIKSVTTNIFQH